MREIPAALQARLDSGATTLCRCWSVTRRDGVRQGFTDHDADVILGELVCRAGSGLTGSEVTAKLGLAVGGSELSGALADDSLNEDDLAAGHYDGADVALWLVDWQEPELRLLLAAGSLGEVRREGGAFVAEMRGASERLTQDSGRFYTASCAADLGDERCGVHLDHTTYLGSGAVLTVKATSLFVVSGLDGFAGGHFSRGRLTFIGGDNAGLSVEVKRHGSAGGVTVELWQAMPHAVQPGDTFTVTAGCDKRFVTCRDRFANAVNFRGFPHIPGNDFVLRYPVPGEPGHTGSSLQA